MSRAVGWVCYETYGMAIINARPFLTEVDRESPYDSSEITAADFGLLEEELDEKPSIFHMRFKYGNS